MVKRLTQPVFINIDLVLIFLKSIDFFRTMDKCQKPNVYTIHLSHPAFIKLNSGYISTTRARYTSTTRALYTSTTRARYTSATRARKVDVVVVIVVQLDLQLPEQSVPITTKVVSSNPVHGEMLPHSINTTEQGLIDRDHSNMIYLRYIYIVNLMYWPSRISISQY